uniref:Sushi domain-containing protein n=1 Tax=Panagrolaimus sp. PS1159 TaxID=55785 RepID=A0AC35GPS3_9BILA
MKSVIAFSVFALCIFQNEAILRFKRQIGVLPGQQVGVGGQFGGQIGGVLPNGAQINGQFGQTGLIGNGINNGPQCLGGPLTPLNGQLSYSTGSIIGPWPAGATAMLTCNAGFMPRGITQSICQNGVFNALGECIPGNNGGIGGVAPIGVIPPVGK